MNAWDLSCRSRKSHLVCHSDGQPAAISILASQQKKQQQVGDKLASRLAKQTTSNTKRETSHLPGSSGCSLSSRIDEMEAILPHQLVSSVLNLHSNDESDISPSSSFSSSSSSSFCASKLSLVVDRRARKKDQNRLAAYNYRRKKMEEKNRLREEEMRLVYSRVCLIGYTEELESSIMYILNKKTSKILDEGGNPICFLCPVCLHSCDNLLNLRNHLNNVHIVDLSNNNDNRPKPH